MINISIAGATQELTKDCIIVVMDLHKVAYNEVWTPSLFKVERLNLLQDWKKFSIVFTQAKKKLVIVGSMSALNNTPTMKNFVSLIVSNKWVLYHLKLYAN